MYHYCTFMKGHNLLFFIHIFFPDQCFYVWSLFDHYPKYNVYCAIFAVILHHHKLGSIYFSNHACLIGLILEYDLRICCLFGFLFLFLFLKLCCEHYCYMFLNKAENLLHIIEI